MYLYLMRIIFAHHIHPVSISLSSSIASASLDSLMVIQGGVLLLPGRDFGPCFSQGMVCREI